MAKDANEVSKKIIEAYQKDLEKAVNAEEREKIHEQIKAIQEKAYEPALAREKTIGQLAQIAGVGVLAIVAAVAGSKMDFGSNRNDDQT